MKIGLVGPSYQQRSLPLDAQRTINLFPIIDQRGGKEATSLLGTPGLHEFAMCGSGSIRGGLKSKNGRVFFVCGTRLYELDSAGTATLRGTLSTSEGKISLAEGTTQLAVCDGSSLYVLTYETNVFAVVDDEDLPSSVGFVSNVDGYFIVVENETGRFFISSNNGATAWAALDYATAESSPDRLIAAVAAVGQLWLFGDDTTEIWTNSGASSFPFARISGAVMKVGLLAKHSAIEIDNTVMWIGKDEFGSGIVYRANGFTPQRISTETIERVIQQAPNPEGLYAWAYQEDGHWFYIISGGGLQTSLAYDLATQEWHERAYSNDMGEFEPHLGSCHVFAFSKHLVGSRRDGKVYEMKLDFYDDDNEEIVRERIYTHLFDEGRRIRYNSLEIGVESGVGLQSGQGSDPLISLQLSKDGARTWSSWFTGSIGKIGKYQTKVKFRRLGVAEQMTFKIRITDKVKVAITGSYLQ